MFVWYIHTCVHVSASSITLFPLPLRQVLSLNPQHAMFCLWRQSANSTYAPVSVSSALCWGYMHRPSLSRESWGSELRSYYACTTSDILSTHISQPLSEHWQSHMNVISHIWLLLPGQKAWYSMFFPIDVLKANKQIINLPPLNNESALS